MKRFINLFFAATAAVALMSTGCSKEEPGTLKGVFSVSETQKVKFAQGNLQFDAATKSYRFADNQWDVKSSTKSLDKPKEADGGVIDRLAWGNPDAPYTTAETFADWGQKPITNGGEKAGIWRTLTADEWSYLILSRTNSAQLFTFAEVNSVKGFVLLPDAWQLPKDMTMKFIPADSLNKNTAYRTRTTDPTDYTTLNAYNVEQWKVLEDAGALFLPFTAVSTFKDKSYYSGQYWTTDANYASIAPTEVWPKRGCRQDAFRMAVRLAKNVDGK